MTVIVDPADYHPVIAELKATGNTTLATRFRLAVKVFKLTSSYDTAIAAWLERRFELGSARIDPARHVLPVAGTREALFSFAQALLIGSPGAVCAMPNPFYQIYEGATLLRGASPWYVPCPAPGNSSLTSPLFRTRSGVRPSCSTSVRPAIRAGP